VVAQQGRLTSSDSTDWYSDIARRIFIHIHDHTIVTELSNNY